MTPYSIHWFRRDLRIPGNTALRETYSRFKGRTLFIFSIDAQFLERPDFSHNRFGFFLKTLKNLKDELQSVGGDLLVLDKGPDEAFSFLMEKSKNRPKLVSFNRDYEPFAKRRDSRITELLEQKYGVAIESHKDHLILEPSDVLKNDGSFYQIYTPFSKRWLEVFSEKKKAGDLKTSLQMSSKAEKLFSLSWKEVLGENFESLDCLDRLILRNSSQITVPLPEAGFKAAIRCVKNFQEKIADYTTERDIPSHAGTSKLSVYLKNGSITTLQVLELLDLQKSISKPTSSPHKYFKELIWREFYYHILSHVPNVENSAFQTKYKNIKWQNNEKFFMAWKNGETGFPIVDAGMHELKQTGWMHNRVRMIVASFLTKDLLVDWRWGAEYFMNELLDGDLAPNNGGWQWAASTGCDSQPYFRIFNPELQLKRFDPNGEYLKRFLPKGPRPKPIVDHATQKIKAIELFKSQR